MHICTFWCGSLFDEFYILYFLQISNLLNFPEFNADKVIMKIILFYGCKDLFSYQLLLRQKPTMLFQMVQLPLLYSFNLQAFLWGAIMYSLPFMNSQSQKLYSQNKFVLNYWIYFKELRHRPGNRQRVSAEVSLVWCCDEF